LKCCVTIDSLDITSSGGRFAGFLDPTNAPPLKYLGGIRPSGVTLLAWVRSNGPATPTKDEVIAAQASDATSCDPPAYRLRYDDADTRSGLQFSVDVGGKVVSSPAGGPGVWNGSWHMVAGT